MTVLAGKKADGDRDVAYEPTFLEAIQPALASIARHRISVAVNAGGSDPKVLHQTVVKMIEGQGLKLKVAWINGDDVFEILNRRRFKEMTSKTFAYLGGLGIAEAFLNGADIVICGRVSDASPVIGASYWWHGWTRENLQEMAYALAAGHMIECSNYVCGGNLSGFKEVYGKNDIGYPIAEIGKKGDLIMTKQKGTGDIVSVDTCKSQLLYEIQGPWYFNSDVTAILDEIRFEQLSSNRVALNGVKCGPPPPTTKIGITAKGGFQAEMHWFLIGLDIEAKARLINNSAAEDHTDQSSATVDFRVFAQAKTIATLMPGNFLRPMMDLVMCAYPGGIFHLDFRQGIPKTFFEYYVTLLPQSDIKHIVHTHDNMTLIISPPKVTKTYPRQQPSHSYTILSSEKDFGETVRGPLGWLVRARSGDKGSNANVGFWVRH